MLWKLFSITTSLLEDVLCLHFYTVIHSSTRVWSHCYSRGTGKSSMLSRTHSVLDLNFLITPIIIAHEILPLNPWIIVLSFPLFVWSLMLVGLQDFFQLANLFSTWCYSCQGRDFFIFLLSPSPDIGVFKCLGCRLFPWIPVRLINIYWVFNTCQTWLYSWGTGRWVKHYARRILWSKDAISPSCGPMALKTELDCIISKYKTLSASCILYLD